MVCGTQGRPLQNSKENEHIFRFMLFKIKKEKTKNQIKLEKIRV